MFGSAILDTAFEGEVCAGEGVGHPVAGVWIVVVMLIMCAAGRPSPAVGLFRNVSPRTGAALFYRYNNFHMLRDSFHGAWYPRGHTISSQAEASRTGSTQTAISAALPSTRT